MSPATALRNGGAREYRPVLGESASKRTVSSQASDSQQFSAARSATDDLAGDVRAAHVAKMITRNPIQLSYPPQIWMHADCPALPELPEPDEEALHELNRMGVARLQAGKYDAAMAAFQDMTSESKRLTRPSTRVRATVLAVVHNNLAGVYYRRGMSAPALQYIQRAAAAEASLYGSVDFATLLRMAAVLARSKAHSQSVEHCTAAIETLRSAAAAMGAEHFPAGHWANSASSDTIGEMDGDDSGAPPDDSSGGAGGADGEGASRARALDAYLAVAYHNLAVELACLQKMQDAVAMASVAEQLVGRALPPKHRWTKQIRSASRRLRDLLVSTTFLQHAIRPRLAQQQARQELADASAPRRATRLQPLWTVGRTSVASLTSDSGWSRASRDAPPGASHARLQETTAMRGSSSLPALRGASKS